MAIPKPDEIEKRLRETLQSTDAARQDLLRRSIDESRQEAKAFGRIRGELIKALGQDDPRIKALDRRVKGNERMADFIESGLGGSPDLKPKDWVVTGQVNDASGKPVEGALVTLESDDQDLVRRFGEVKTGKDGRFEVRHAGQDFEDIFKRGSTARIVVTSPDGKLTQTTDEIQPAGGQTHEFKVGLRPERPARGAKKGVAKGDKEEPG